jgi:hypothetical protein
MAVDKRIEATGRRSAKRSASAAIIVLATLLAACSGGRNSAPTPDSSTTPATNATPVPRAVINGRHVDDPMGYSADIPAGWTAHDNNVVAARLITDIFFSPESRDGVTPNLAVSCDVLVQPVTAADFTKEHAATVKGLAALDYGETSGKKVDGHDATFVTYELKRPQATIRVTEYLVVSGDCAWIFALTVPASDPPASDTTLDTFMASVKITK